MLWKKKNAPLTVPPEETAAFCEQIAQMLEGGIMLEDGADTLCKVYAGTKYEAAFQVFSDKIHECGTLTEALEACGIFPAYLIQMAQIGEKSGTLEESMRSSAEYYRQEAQVRSDLKNAVRYPIALAAVMLVLVGIMLIVVLPIFRGILDGLPGGSVSSSAVRFGTVASVIILVLTGLLIAGGGVIVAMMNSGHRVLAEDLLSRFLPPLKSVLKSLSAARFASVMGRLLNGGYPTEEALALAESVAAEEQTKAKFAKCREIVQSGKLLSEATGETDVFSPLHQQMVQVGEGCGQLDKTLLSIADILRAQTDERLERLIGLVEPVLVGVLAVVLGALLLAVMLPLIGVLIAM